MNDSTKALNEDMVNKSIACQQILDSLHQLVYHTVYIKTSDVDAVFKSKHTDDFDHICDDIQVETICDLIENQRKNSQRYRDPKRDEDGGDSKHYNKFQTTNKIESEALSNGSGNEKQKCFMDVLLLRINANKQRKGIQTREIQKLADFILDEMYDSDAIISDLQSITPSNFEHLLALSSPFQEYALTLVKEKQIRNKLYDGGRRYFYWDFYKDNCDEKHVIFVGSMDLPLYEKNPGYKLCDWYIPQKYTNLKEELLHNVICAFSVQQFENTMVQANDKLTAWIDDTMVGNIRCEDPEWSISYGIEEGDEITLQHIVSVMFYTNYSKQCYEFSATFRKCGEYETDESMKA
eukprot:45575_1